MIIIEVLYGIKVSQGLMRTIEVIFNKPFSESLVEQNRFRCEITYLCPKMSLFIRISEKTQRGGEVDLGLVAVRGSSLQRRGIREPGTIHVTAAHYQNMLLLRIGWACGSLLAWDGRS